MNAQAITAIRYAELGKIAFTYRGAQGKLHEIKITEPDDVILVGSDPVRAAYWIATRYDYLLRQLD